MITAQVQSMMIAQMRRPSVARLPGPDWRQAEALAGIGAGGDGVRHPTSLSSRV